MNIAAEFKNFFSYTIGTEQHVTDNENMNNVHHLTNNTTENINPPLLDYIIQAVKKCPIKDQQA